MGGISQYIEVTNARQVLNNARVNLANAYSDCRQAEIDLLAAIEAAFPPYAAASPTSTPSALSPLKLPEAGSKQSPAPANPSSKETR